MAKKKQEDPPKGAPAWMNTFSDLMNLLLCFFVLLFSMSTVDTDKLEAVVASLQNAISILPTGGTSIGEGEMISAGVRQLEFLDSYYNEMANSKAENTDEQTDGKLSAQEQYEQQQLAESEKMADEIQQELDNSQLSGKVDVDFNAEYVKLNLNGSILFASAVVASLQNAISILPTGGTSIGEGEMISAGVRQLEFLDSYYNEMANSKAENTDEQTDGKLSAQEQYEQQQLAESEKMADEIQQELDNSQLSGKVDVDFNAEYVKLNLNGSILFASGKADLVKQAVPIVNKLGKILEKYNKNVIEIEGHTDNVPIRYSAKYENNEVLSVYRALAVTDQLRKNKNLNPKYIKFAGRGDYIPVADNSTAEGRAQNRRVEIKIYNSFNSNVKENN